MRPTEATLQRVVERDRGRCALCADEVYGPRGQAWSLHHRRPRGMGSTRRLETNLPGNLVLLHGSGTTGCHHQVERNRAVSYDRGFLVRQNAIPSLTVIAHAVHGLVLLDDEGGVSPADECEESPGGVET